jgi:hypothetical protein
MCDELSQTEFAEMLGVILGYPDTVFVQLALQEELDKAGVKMNVKVEAA